ncbi:MAG: hypothetical protein H6744_02795 [Deltaproteobacteria bacterium]|nr:hypothetical protein [Deltaproteobacteria bacterium]MCB9785601.1 hypothetical protein [Deltaproteobacteria bacterium]
MKQRLLGVFLCLGLVGASAPGHATQSRINAMGGHHKAITIDDEVNIFTLPSLLVRYGNLTYIDNINEGFGNTVFGFHYSLTEDMVLAIYGGRINAGTRGTGDGFDAAGNAITGSSAVGAGAQASQAELAGGGTTGVTSPVTGQSAANVDYKIGLLYALNLGATARLGLMVNILGDDGDVEQPTGARVDQGALLIDLALGFGLDLSGGDLDMSVGFEIGAFGDERDGINNRSGQPDVLVENFAVDRHFGFRLEARGSFDFFDQSHIVPFVRLHTGSQEVSNKNLPLGTVQSGSWKAFDLTVGSDIVFQPFENVFVAPGIGLRFAQQTLEGSAGAAQSRANVVDRDLDRRISLPFYSIGVDVQLLKWLDFRFGAWQSVDFNRASETRGGTTTEKRSSDVVTEIKTGLGFNLPVAESTLSLDIDVNPLYWVNGPDFLTGAGNSTDGFGVSGAIKYDW